MNFSKGKVVRGEAGTGVVFLVLALASSYRCAQLSGNAPGAMSQPNGVWV